MLDIGRTYTIRLWEDGDDGGAITTHHGCKVIERDGTLIKIKQTSEPPLIINTASIAFVSAKAE